MCKIHKSGINCGDYPNPSNLVFSDNFDEITCTKCKRLIQNNLPNKKYRITFKYDDRTFIVSAPTKAKAVYKCFKNFFFYSELCENIGIQFLWFKRSKPKAVIEKENSIEPTLTYQEQEEKDRQEIQQKCDEWNLKYPIGTEVLFQADGDDTAIVTKTRSAAKVYSNYLVIWLDGISSSYILKDDFVQPLTDQNRDLKRLRY